MRVIEDKSRLEKVVDEEHFKKLVLNPDSEYVRINIGFPLRYSHYVNYNHVRYFYRSKRRLKFQVTNAEIEGLGYKINLLNFPIRDGQYNYSHEFIGFFKDCVKIDTEGKIRIKLL